MFRYNEMTGDFIDVFVFPGSSKLGGPRGLLVGRDGNLYVSSFDTNSVMRYDGTTGAPLPAPGQMDAFFVPPGSGRLQGPAGLILGRDGNLYVNSKTNNSVRRYSGTTGEFLDVFVPSGSGGLNAPKGLVFGPDDSLYITSGNSVLRYNGATGAPSPAPGQMGALFAYRDGLGAGLVFQPDGNLYIPDSTHFGVLRFNGATGEFIDTFVSPGTSGPYLPAGSGLLFGPDNNLYVSSRGTMGPLDSQVLRYDGTTGAFIDAFVPSGSGGLIDPTFLSFTNSDPTTLAYVPPLVNRFLIRAPPIAVSGTPFDITLTALDSYGNIDTNYQGTVTFSTSDLDPGVVLPADYTFTTGVGGDNGAHTFPGGVTLVTAGDQTLASTNTVSGITGSATVTVGPGP